MIATFGSYGRFVLLLFLGMAILFFDFFTKAYVYYLIPIIDACGAAEGIVIFRNVLGVDFSINLAINRGAAWGLFSDFQLLLLVIRFLVVIGMILYLFFMNTQRGIDIPLVLIIAGAVGNIIDFFLYGYVVDFLHFNFWGYHFPVFNLADSSITLGVIGLFLVALFSKKKQLQPFKRNSSK